VIHRALAARAGHEPGFDTAYAGGGQGAITDGMLLSAIQANWAHVEAVYVPPPVVIP